MALRTFFIRSEFTRNVSTLALGTVLAQAVPFLMSPVYSRLFSPDDFGVFGLYMAIAGLAATISTGRFEQAIILPKGQAVAGQVVLLSLGVLFVFVLLSFLVALLGFLVFSFDWIFLTIPLMVLCISLANILDRNSNRAKNYRLMSLQRLAKSSAEAAGALILQLVFFVDRGLVWGSLLGYLSSSLLLLYRNAGTIASACRKCSPRRIAAVASRFRKFPLFNMPHALFNVFSSAVPVFLIPLFFGNPALGYYSFGLRIVQAPLGIISLSFYNVIAQKLAELRASGKELFPFFRKVLLSLVGISVLVSPILFFAPSIFTVCFGHEWVNAGKYIQILSVSILLGFVLSPLASIPMVFFRQKKAFVVELVGSCLKTGAILFAGFGLSIFMTLGLFAAAGSIVMLYNLYWYFSLVKNSRKLPDMP